MNQRRKLLPKMLLLSLLLIALSENAFVHGDGDLYIETDCPLSSNSMYPTCDDWLNRQFDFIIAGAGTAGCTLANRLTEISAWNVLLLEAGGIPSNLSEIPGLYMALQKTPEDWAFQAQGQRTSSGYKNSISSWAKGKALGGSSTINSMVTVPGVPADYNQWALLGNEGWNWANVTDYFDKVEAQIKVTRYRSPLALRTVVEEAARELGLDTSGASIFGYRDVPLSVDGGQRYSYAKAYLSPIKDRNNLCVVTGAEVTGLWFDAAENVQGVRVNNTKSGELVEIKAGKEVILSAGSINTPQILLLSGIGPRDNLPDEIPLKTNLPVGCNLMDHMVIPIIAQELTPSSPTDSLDARLEAYCENRTILSNLGMTNFQGYIHTRNSTWSMRRPTRPNIEIIHFFLPVQEPMLNIILDRMGYLDFYQTQIRAINEERSLQLIMVDLLHPKSRGTVKLRSTNPYEQPAITPNYLSHPKDTQTVLEGIDFVEHLMNTQSMSDYELVDLQVPECVQFAFGSRGYWDCYATTFATTVFHPSGTCTMGDDPARSVVTPRLEVWNVPNLRVVDSSVIPELMSGHPNIPVGMIAEKAADFIKSDYGRASQA